MTTPKELWREARSPPAEPTGLSFQDKAVLVTGANSGLGYASAIKYAELGASPLILAVRSQEKGEAARASIVHKTGHAGEIIILILELSNFASVSAFADQVNERVAKLDVALLCAGIAVPDYKTTLRLLPKLRAAAAASSNDNSLPHLCFLNSLASHVVNPEWLPPAGQTLIGALNDRSKFDLTRHYYLAKLAAWFSILGIVERSQAYHDAHEVVINACCPGMCRTNMQRDLPWFQRITQKMVLLPLSRSAEEGSRFLISATWLGPESTGKFWRNDEYLPPGEVLESERGKKLASETWNEILNIIQPYLKSGNSQA
ncbi:hypothetical protein CHU98_g8241 [Xylaria longipes]|nr:hypothetical protein CHU98_g8241 [Xylaria longipes]